MIAAISSAQESQFVEKPRQPSTRHECVVKGGQWIFAPMGKFFFCSSKASDAGKACSDDKECEGDCILITHQAKLPGVCAATFPIVGGCPKHLVDGKVISEPCI
jgi:hypothetical protein